MTRLTARRVLPALAVLVLAGIQFVPARIDRVLPDPAPSLARQLEPSADITRLLERSCNDCHGATPTWPWYSYVAPISWLLGRDVREAKEHLDFTRWADHAPRAQARLLGRMCEEAQKGQMPPQAYSLVHRGAPFSADETKLFCAWIERAQARLADAAP